MSEDLLAVACPRCGGGFECGVNTGNCACLGVRLNDRLRAELAGRYPGTCLCMRCLRELIEADALQPVIGSASASG